MITIPNSPFYCKYSIRSLNKFFLNLRQVLKQVWLHCKFTKTALYARANSKSISHISNGIEKFHQKIIKVHMYSNSFLTQLIANCIGSSFSTTICTYLLLSRVISTVAIYERTLVTTYILFHLANAMLILRTLELIFF